MSGFVTRHEWGEAATDGPASSVSTNSMRPTATDLTDGRVPTVALSLMVERNVGPLDV